MKSHVRQTPVNFNKEEFKRIGHQLIDTVSEFIEGIEQRQVTTGESPKEIQQVLGNSTLPIEGMPAEEVVSRATALMLNHSLLNGHPKFLGYITSSATPIGALADLLAAAVNPNVGANILSPMATAIEKQTVKWLAEFIGVPGYGGLLVSGGNMANFTAFLAARTAKAPKSLKEEGLIHMATDMVVYCSKATHTWIEKAVTLFGHGTRSIRWIPTDALNRMDNTQLKAAIEKDTQEGKTPFMIVGTAGDVSTGAVDDLKGIAAICNTYQLWFHIDGAYGAPAAALPELQNLFDGLEAADSIAIDPHKWLYAPLEAGCTLVKNPQHLIDTFSSHPTYYNFSAADDEPSVNFYEYGLQNSRGFRALKVWMALQHIGKTCYIKMIRDDISLAICLYQMARQHPELEVITQHLSITTLRFVPLRDKPVSESYLNILNEKLLNVLQSGGEVFLSNAVIADKYCLRACVVNFRTSPKDMEEIITIILREGRKVDEQLSANG